MNFYTLASKLNKKIIKETCDRHVREIDSDPKEVYNNVFDQNMREFESNCRLGIQLMLKFKEIATDEGMLNSNNIKQTYFITIRPDTSAIKFYEFYNTVSNYLNRKCFIDYKCSFEQKGTNDETLGQGFHVHIIAKMRQRSKGEVLRDTQRTFKQSTSANCIQVDLLKTTEDLNQTIAYLDDYTSDDGHKMPTKEWDKEWRKRLGLQDSYKILGPLPAIKSGAGSVIIKEISAVIPLGDTGIPYSTP